MNFLFLHKNEPITQGLGMVKSTTFSNGLLADCSFVNGYDCEKCGCLTEHDRVDGSQICKVCGTPKIPLGPTAQFLDYKAYLSAIKFYSDKIEFETIEKILGLPEGDERGVADWVQVRGQLHSNKILEEVIRNAKW